MNARPDLEVLDCGGWPIAYTRAGRGAPIVFLHNGGTSHAIWRHTAARLANRYDCIAPDLLGYGDSAKPGNGYTMDAHVGVLSDLIDAHGLSRVSIVGNCMGSAIALRYAMKRPNAVRALVLINPLTEATFLAGGFGATLRFRRRAPRLGAFASRQLARVRLPRWAASPVVSMQVGSRANVADADADALCACYASPGQMTSLLAVLDDMASYRALDQLVPADDFPPLATIWGAKNRVLSPAAGRQLNTTLQPARQTWLDDCGHLPMVERPDAVAGAIDAFLTEVAP